MGATKPVEHADFVDEVFKLATGGTFRAEYPGLQSWIGNREEALELFKGCFIERREALIGEAADKRVHLFRATMRRAISRAPQAYI